MIVDDEDRRYPETVGLYYDTNSKKATSTSNMVVQQKSPGYSHLQPSLLPHLVLLPLLRTSRLIGGWVIHLVMMLLLVRLP